LNRELILVRHGQASFLAANYDNLSATGQLQSRRLGQHLLREGYSFNTVLTGTLLRQKETARLILEAFPEEIQSLATMTKGLNEFPPSVWDAHGGLLRRESRSFQMAALKVRLARKLGKTYIKGYIECAGQILQSWGRRNIPGCPSFSDFLQGVQETFNNLPQQGVILIVSSNTPCALLAGMLLGRSVEESMQSMIQIYNTAFSIFIQHGSDCAVLAENSQEHLPEELRTFI
jgi:broad specificity phosphatase PhoE